MPVMAGMVMTSARAQRVCTMEPYRMDLKANWQVSPTLLPRPPPREPQNALS